MQTYAPDERLKPGDIFDELETSGISENPVSYVMLGSKDGFMRVSELGGENRDARLVHPQDIPRPDKYKKWQYREERLSLQCPDELRSMVLKELRDALPFLRTANELNASVSRGGLERTGGPSLFTAHEVLTGGKFGLVEYALNPGGVHPTLMNFDLIKLGIVPDNCLEKDEAGQPKDLSVKAQSTQVTQREVEIIQSEAKKMGILVFADAYLGQLINERTPPYRGRLPITGYIPDNMDPTCPRLYSNLADANAAVMAIHTEKS